MTRAQHDARDWMIVRKSPRIPGGWRVVQYGLTQEQAERRCAAYKRPHSVMREPELLRIRLAAIAAGERF